MSRRRYEIRVDCGRMLFEYPSTCSLSIWLVILLYSCGRRAQSTSAPLNDTTMSGGGVYRLNEKAGYQPDFNFGRAARQNNSRALIKVASLNGKNISRILISARNDDKYLPRNSDLLAIGSAEKYSSLTSSLRQHEQSHRSPPYAEFELSSKTNLSSLSETSQSSNDTTQLLKLHRTQATAPLYLRHTLPISITRPHIIALEHPASTRKQSQPFSQNENGYTTSNNSMAGIASSTFAILPSWPNIYIAQRQQLSDRNKTDSSERDSKVPNKFPNWSTRNETSHALKSDLSVAGEPQHQENGSDYVKARQDTRTAKLHSIGQSGNAGVSNLTASEVEYEETPSEQRLEAKTGHSNATNWAELLRQAAESKVPESLMLTDKSVVSLLCDPESMLVRIKFRLPFYGMVRTISNTSQECRLFGNGNQYYEMRIDLYDCGTRQETPRLFINSLVFRFHDPFDLNRSRMLLSQEEQQQNVNSGREKSIDELKTIICSYPARAHAPILSQGQLNPQRNDLNKTSSPFERPPKNSTPTNLSGRIIEAPNQDNRGPALLINYEPILLISGVVLLAIALLLASITSAYLFQKSRRKFSSGSKARVRSPTAHGSRTVSARNHNQSQTQIATGHNTPLVAPPLIGLQKAHQTRLRPSAKRYAADLDTRSSSKQQLKSDKRTHLVPNSQMSRGALTNRHKSGPWDVSADDTGDSLESVRKGGDRSSVTTIEIPFVGPARANVSPLPGTQSSSRKFERDEAVQTDLSGKREIRYHTEYKHMKSHEKIVETVHQSEPNSSNQVVKDENEQKRQSPVPFGSFRSKLTSPTEFKRLENVMSLFEDDRYESNSEFSRLKMRIQRALTGSEKRRLMDLLHNDEVFRSNILDSLDYDTFTRKLRDNPNYSNKFSSATWRLLGEILLEADLNKLVAEKRAARNEFGSNKSVTKTSSGGHEIILSKSPSTNISYVEQKAGKKSKTYTSRAVRELATSNNQEEAQAATSLSDDSIGAIRLSQSNSTTTKRIPHGTSINVDSVTNISTPANFSAYTRSSFHQTTRYEEDQQMLENSLPYMDEILQSSAMSSLDRERGKQVH